MFFHRCPLIARVQGSALTEPRQGEVREQRSPQASVFKAGPFQAPEPESPGEFDKGRFQELWDLILE